MLLFMRKKSKYILGILAGLLLMSLQPVWAAGPPEPSIFNNPLALILIILMILLLIIIAILANILIGAADVKLKKRKQTTSPVLRNSLLLVFLLISGSSLFAQGTVTETTKAVVKSIGGMQASTFYIMAFVIFIELAIIMAMLINIKFLLKSEKEKVILATEPQAEKLKKEKLSWWDRFNKLKPVSEEAELDLGHEYDGIRELNNRLPPWWLYGFYLTIIFAGIYLWRFHVAHTAPSSKEEFENSIAKADLKIQKYLLAKGDAVDENTVILLKSPDDIAAGKLIFSKSCVTCHTETGAGNIGPNLTDNFWLNGNDIKSVFKTIRYGINAMPQWQNTYSNKQIAQVASYVKSLLGTNPPNPKAPQGVEMKEAAVPAKEAVDSLNAKPVTDSLKAKSS
ncbi:MAG: cbb3-type cytochrome c oxidase N-terminal domain-containing protein [Chitinophagaceae bacterium]